MFYAPCTILISLFFARIVLILVVHCCQSTSNICAGVCGAKPVHPSLEQVIKAGPLLRLLYVSADPRWQNIVFDLNDLTDW